MIIFSIDCMSITEPVTTTTSFDADRKMEGELFKYKDMSLCVYLLNNLCFLQQIAIISKRFRNFAVKNAKFFDLKVQSVTQILRLGNKNKRVCFVFLSTFCNFGFTELTRHSEMKRKANFPFAFLSFFRNFVRFLSFSLYKGYLGN